MCYPRICYPENYTMRTAAMRYGCAHEILAVVAFRQYFEANHTNATVLASGFKISIENTYFGASPDVMGKCDCCGTFSIEIKCPGCLRNGEDISAVLHHKNQYLVKKEGRYRMNRKHEYFCQVKM